VSESYTGRDQRVNNEPFLWLELIPRIKRSGSTLCEYLRGFGLSYDLVLAWCRRFGSFSLAAWDWGLSGRLSMSLHPGQKWSLPELRSACPQVK
jgi:hypothetical protein